MALPPLPYVIAGAAILGIFMRRPSARSGVSTISPPSNDEGQYSRNPQTVEHGSDAFAAGQRRPPFGFRRNWRPCKARSACVDAGFRPFGAHMVRVQ